MKKRRKVKKQKVLPPLDVGFTVKSLNKEFLSDRKQNNAGVYVQVGNQMLRVIDTYFYPSGIQGRPSFILKTVAAEIPAPTDYDIELTKHILAFLRLRR